MITDKKILLGYGHIGKRKTIRRIIVCVLVMVCVSVPLVNREYILAKLSLLYYQHQCSTYEMLADVPLLRPNNPGISDYGDYVGGDPRQQYRFLMPGCVRFLVERAGLELEVGPAIFLHKMISPNGSTRIVFAQFLPTTHAQFCRIECLSISPGTWLSPPSVQRTNLFVPGWWSDGVQLDKLRPAQLDPTNPSHWVFSYNYGSLARMNALRKASFSQYIDKTLTVDAYLKDDGNIQLTMKQGQ